MNAGDRELLNVVKEAGTATIAELAARTGVTATAIRQRLTRLMETGFVRRQSQSRGRGRPNHTYEVVPEATSRFASNYPDLVLALWGAVKELDDPKARRAIGQSVRDTLVQLYRSQVAGDQITDRVSSLMSIMADRGVRMDAANSNGLSILREHDCPYPELASVDRGICALEKQIFDRVLGTNVKLTQCQMFGHSHCEFRLRATPLIEEAKSIPVSS